MYNIYTNGACKDNRQENGVGGWAFIILENVPGKDMQLVSKISGKKMNTTNQEMEIIAVSEAFSSLSSNGLPINLYSDSAYVINCLKDRWYDKWRENGWLNSKLKPVENRESWEIMLENVEKHNNVNFFHINKNSTKFIKIVNDIAKMESRNEPSNDSKCSGKRYK